MGNIFADLELSNPKQDSLQPIKVKALADTGALMLLFQNNCSSNEFKKRSYKGKVAAGDVPYVGPIKVAFGDFVLWEHYLEMRYC